MDDPGFVSVYDTRPGYGKKKRRVPAHYVGHPILGRNIALTPLELANSPVPSEGWTRDDLDVYVAGLGIDTTEEPNKAAVMAAINAATTPDDDDIDPDDDDTPDPDGTPPSDQTPA